MAFVKMKKLVQCVVKCFKGSKTSAVKTVRSSENAQLDESTSAEEYYADQNSNASAVDPYEHMFGSILHIEDYKLRKIARLHLADKIGDRCWVLETLGGSYNRVFVVQFDIGTDETVKYVIRIPYYGKPETWTEEDALGFRSDVLTLRYIKKHTGLPVPDIVAYSDTCDNELGHPYTLMTFMQGTRADEYWYEDDDQEQTRPETEEWRRKFLKSLANIMSKLQNLRFAAGGRLEFENDDDENPTVAPAYTDDDFDVHNPNHGANHNVHFIPVETSKTKKHFKELIEKWWDKWMEDHRDVEVGQLQAEEHKGHFQILSSMIEALPIPDDEDDDNADSSEGQDDLVEGDKGTVGEAEHSEGDGSKQNGGQETNELENNGGEEHDGKDRDEGDCTRAEQAIKILVPRSTSMSTAVASSDQETSRLFPEASEETGATSIEATPGATRDFVLCHPDLDLQNIFVNEEGEVVGIIDWDHLKTKRCSQGWISMPWFLKCDWGQSFTDAAEPPKGYVWDGDPLWTVEHIDKYREAYAQEITGACSGKGDSVYAKKSHLYDALEEALIYQERTGPVVDMMLRAILPRVDITDYLHRVGSEGHVKGERKLLEERFQRLFQY